MGSAGTIDSSQTRPVGDNGDWKVPSGYDMSHGVIRDCANSGRIIIDTPSEAGRDRFDQVTYAQSSNVGGIAGYSRASVYNCTNGGSSLNVSYYGYLACPRASSIGGIVGGLRTLTSNSNYSGNFSSEGTDDGMVKKSADAITVSGCTNTGDIQGFVFAAGICGRAGTYTTITDCLDGVSESGQYKETYIVAHRWNKPFPAGIAGSTYGTISYCANFANVASVSDFDQESHSIVTQSGYYAAGIVGNTSRFTDQYLAPVSPLPEVYSCYNAGSVLANANMRQRALVGDNGGYVHDNVAIEGCVTTNDLLYGDDEGESEASGGSSANNTFATRAQLLGNEEIADAGTVVCGVLNNSCNSDGWSNYWTQPHSNEANLGYPVLERQIDWTQESLSTAKVGWGEDAEYTGLVSIPKAKVTTSGGTVLRQNVDFRVEPQDGATDVTGGKRNYTATVYGIGRYKDEAGTFTYGIGKGDLAGCTVSIDTKQYNAQPQTLKASDAHVLNSASGEVDSSEYTVTISPDNVLLTNGKVVNAGKYDVIIEAKSSSTHFYGKNTSGVLNVKTASIICPKDDDTSAGNYASPDGVTFAGKTIDWYSKTQHLNDTVDDLVKAGVVFPYTGHPIKPEVTGVTFSGSTVSGKLKLTESVDYRVVYGATAIASTNETVDNIGAKGKRTIGYVMVRYVPGSNFSNYEVMAFVIDGTSSEKLDLADAEIRGGDGIVYEEDAGAYKPIEVWYGGSQLTEGVDYEITYSDNTAIGTAKYTVKAKDGGLFKGTVSGTFEIAKGAAYTISYDYDDATATATVTGVVYHGSKDGYALVIPESVKKGGNTYTVKAIADYACGTNAAQNLTDSQTKITSVTIPATVETIGKWAFCTVDINTFNLSKIAEVTFAKGSKLKSIGQGAFRQTSIEELTVPASVAAIGDKAFARCSNLQKVMFETKTATVPVIEKTAFQFVRDVDAYYDVKATAVDTYVTDTIKSQNWNHANAPKDDGGSSGSSSASSGGASSTSGSSSSASSGSAASGGSASSGSASKPSSSASSGSTSQDDSSASSGSTKPSGSSPASSDSASSDDEKPSGSSAASGDSSQSGSSETPGSQDNSGKTSSSAPSGTSGQSSSTDSGQSVEPGGETPSEGGNGDPAPSEPLVADWHRLWGQTGLDTMVEIAKAGDFPQGGVVVLATFDGYWDALTAAGIAGITNAPVLMTYTNELADQTKTLLAELAPKTIVVCGGTAALTDDVAKQASRAAGNAKTIRCAGKTATGTACEIFNGAVESFDGTWSNSAFICTNDGYWDALAAAPISYAAHMPIFLTEGKTDISTETINTMKSGGIDSVYLVGGTAAIGEEVATKLKSAGFEIKGRLWGQTAIETSEQVAGFGVESCNMTTEHMGAATNNGYWDALSGAALCGRLNGVLVLVEDEHSDSINTFVKSHSDGIGDAYVFGGEAAVSKATYNALVAAG